MAIQRRAVPSQQKPCDNGCAESNGSKVMRQGSETYRKVGALARCFRCGTVWKVKDAGWYHNSWRQTSAKEQARYDRNRMRNDPEYVPFFKQFWQLIR